MHSNTNDEVYLTAGKMMQQGANIGEIIQNLFHSKSIGQLKLLGKILEGVKVTGNHVAVSGIKEEDFAKCESQASDVSGAIDYLSMVKENQFATLLVEDSKGNVKGSLRTRKNDINLSEMATMFGGGGHKKASGFTIKGRLKKEVIWSIQPNKN
jgi:phosphoesterase RecJ-like protein